MHQRTETLCQQLRDDGLLDRAPLLVLTAVLLSYELLCLNGDEHADELARDFRDLLVERKNGSKGGRPIEPMLN
jgi:hypothetical protein